VFVSVGWPWVGLGYGAGGWVEHLLAMCLRSLHTVHRVDRLNRQLEQHVLELYPMNSNNNRTPDPVPNRLVEYNFEFSVGDSLPYF
jgi:hypothetical protein